jgi:hypothetical protein
VLSKQHSAAGRPLREAHEEGLASRLFFMAGPPTQCLLAGFYWCGLEPYVCATYIAGRLPAVALAGATGGMPARGGTLTAKLRRHDSRLAARLAAKLAQFAFCIGAALRPVINIARALPDIPTTTFSSASVGSVRYATACIRRSTCLKGVPPFDKRVRIRSKRGCCVDKGLNEQQGRPACAPS